MNILVILHNTIQYYVSLTQNDADQGALCRVALPL